MKVIKNINNNVAICLDSNHNEVVAFGKGIGYGKPPYEVDLKKIKRVYYNVSQMYVRMINEIPADILDISIKVIDQARRVLKNEINANIVFTLADHIAFAIKRYEKQLDVKLPIVYDVQFLFEEEMRLGELALQLIQKRRKVFLPQEEAAYIALHIVNAEEKNKNRTEDGIDQEIIERITAIIEESFHLHINQKGFNYSRFVSHIHYLIRRGKENNMVKSENDQLYASLAESFPKTEDCANQISQYLQETLGCTLSDEEKMYLMLHINRLCAREDCNQ